MKRDKGSKSGQRVNWLNILHFYQPPFQDMEIVRKVTDECYLPVSRVLLEREHAKAVVNINGCLLEMLDGFQAGQEVITSLKHLYASGRIELTGTGKYHPIFPLITTKEIKIQLLRQEMSLNSFFGMDRTPEILFPPELAFWPGQSPVFAEQGYQWMVVDEISVKSGRQFIGRRLLKETGQDISLLVRERDLSEALAGSIWRKYDIRTPGDFLQRARKRIGEDGFIVTASDVEVYGHHRKGRWELLAEIYDTPSIESVSLGDIAGRYETEEVETFPASWSTSTEDIAERVYYPLWHHPGNSLHRLLWQLIDMTADEVRSNGSGPQNKQMDMFLCSCPFFWASCMPWWNGTMAEDAADKMFTLLSGIQGADGTLLEKAETLRDGIYTEVARLNNTGKAEQLQNRFLKEHDLDGQEVYHLLH